MSGVVYIRFFGDDWLSGTQELSLEERGALITLVALHTTTGLAPVADYKRLARRFGCTPNKAKKIISTLIELGKIHLENDKLHNHRAIKETQISQKNSKKQSENASARWSKNSEKSNKNNGRNDSTALPPECQPEPEPDKREDTNVSSRKKPPVRKSRIDPTARCSDEFLEVGLSQGFSDEEVAAQFERFRDSAVAIGRMYANWPLAFRNWFHSEYFRPIKPASKSTPTATEEEKISSAAQLIKSGKKFLCMQITAAIARDAIEQGLVSQDECQQVGISI